MKEEPHPAGNISGSGPVFLLKDTGQEGLFAARYRLSNFNVEIAEHAFTRRRNQFPRRLLDHQLPRRPALRSAIYRGGTRPRFRQRRFRSRCCSSRRKSPAPRRLGSLGRHRFHRLDSLFPRPAQNPLHLLARRRHSRRGAATTKSMSCSTATSISNSPNKSRVCPSAGARCPSRKRRKLPTSAPPLNPTTSPAASARPASRKIQSFVDNGGLLITLGSGSMLALEGGIVRGVRRVSGGVPRSDARRRHRCRCSRAGRRHAHARRSPPRHVRSPRSSDCLRLSRNTYVFRQNFPLYDAPRRWLRMAYCTTCLDGPIDRSGIVLEWGDLAGAIEAAPILVSGQIWGEGNLIGRPAILDSARRQAATSSSFNFNPIPPRPESRRPTPGLERHPQLAKNPRSAAIGIHDPRRHRITVSEPKIS